MHETRYFTQINSPYRHPKWGAPHPHTTARHHCHRKRERVRMAPVWPLNMVAPTHVAIRQSHIRIMIRFITEGRELKF